MAGSHDLRLRAFDEATGSELWSAALPAAGNALPMTYVAGGRQYVVIAAGGHKELRTKLGDYVVGFALPGALAVDTMPRPLPGVWAGELRVEEDRHPATVTLRASGDSLVGDLLLHDIGLTGAMTVRSSGTALTYVISFVYPAKHCAGTIRGEGAQANGGSLLTGALHLSSTCGEHVEEGTFALWRK